MATISYNSAAYKQLPQSPSRYEFDGVFPRVAGTQFVQQIYYNVPIGTVTGDFGYLFQSRENFAVTSPQIAGLRIREFILTSSANAGGTMTFNLGWLTAGASAFGASLTTVQSAGTTTIAAAVIQAAPVIVANDILAMSFNAAGPTTTACLVTGWIRFDVAAPTGP